jgi:murein DD-endopeptidase MepM/ murein hydrolase activator NlpD
MDQIRHRILLLCGVALLLHASSGVRPLVPVELPVHIPGRSSAPAAAPDLLSGRTLTVPVQGVRASQLRDNFSDARGAKRKHKALDIMAPRGTPVLAADDGQVAKISSNKAGGLAVYQVDASGHIVYYYAHLDRYAEDLREGQALHRGDVIGYVGTTGNAPETAPHLHFAVLLLERKGRWWGGEALNPYDALVHQPAVVAARR